MLQCVAETYTLVSQVNRISIVHQCVAVCCSVLQCVAVCCSVLQRELQCVAVRCNMLRYFVVCCSVWQYVAETYTLGS